MSRQTPFWQFYDQPISPNYYYFLNDDNDNENYIPGTPVDDVITDNKGVEDSVVKNDEDTDNETIIYFAESLASAIDPLQNEILKTEGVDAEN